MSRCTWSANHLPHTEHDDCAGFMPQLAQDLQRLMDRQARREQPPADHGDGSGAGGREGGEGA